MLQEIHKSHQGLEKSLRFTRDFLVFWPSITAEIKGMLSECDTCNSFHRLQPKEPLIPHEVPEINWLKSGVDLFEMNGKVYLLLVDYFSKYFEFNFLENTLSRTIITYCKSKFARHGIPQTIHSDNGSQFVAKKLRIFVRFFWYKSYNLLSTLST